MTTHSNEHAARMASMLDTTTTVLREGEEARDDATVVNLGAVKVAVDPVLAAAHLDEFRFLSVVHSDAVLGAMRIVALGIALGAWDEARPPLAGLIARAHLGEITRDELAASIVALPLRKVA